MTFQHLNRLVAHWHSVTLPDKNGELKGLNASDKLVAVYLAANLRSDGEWANSFYHSGEALAEELDLNRSTAYKALGRLITAGVFDCRTINKEGLRAYSLTLDCPPGCFESKHYTKLERVGRDGFTAHQKTTLGEPIADKQPAVKADSGVRQNHTATRLTPATEPHTYRELNKQTNKELDIKTLASFDLNNLDQLQERYVSTIGKAVARVKDKSAEHSLLADYLVTNPELIMTSALGLVAKHKPDSDEAYLATIATDTPGQLLTAYNEVMNLSDAPRGDSWPENEENIVRQAALEIGSWELATLKEEYNEYLLGSGLIPADLVEIAKTSLDWFEKGEPEPRTLGSLAELVIDLRACQYGFDSPQIDPETLEFELGEWDWYEPYSSIYPLGTKDPGYLAVVELQAKRETYRASFDQRQNDFLASLGLDPFENDISQFVNSDFVKNLEAERASNPELNGDSKHYAALIKAELETLPECQTFAERSTSSEVFESVLLPKVKAEFREFWNACPVSEEFAHKGRRVAALNAYLHTRKWFASHDYIMAEVKKHDVETEGDILPVVLLDYINQTPSPGYLYTEEENPHTGVIRIVKPDRNPDSSRQLQENPF